MSFLWRWLKRLILTAVILVLALLAPVAYVEFACQGDPADATDYAAILPPEHHRPEARTLMTYPEWHIVHAYDDYAEVIATQDPHNFAYLRAIGGYWTTLCALTEAAADHGGVDTKTKQMVYVIGVSFSAELAAKAAYEETLGRIATLMRGPVRAPLDDLSATQARTYATFLQQVPWHQYDFLSDAAALSDTATLTSRDTERNWALGAEYRVKAAYAKVIAAAVEATGVDALTLRMIVTGTTAEALAAFPDITVIAERREGIEIETPRYRKLTNLLAEMAAEGIDFVEIAGNDDILLTTTAQATTREDAFYIFARQGYADERYLLLVKVPTLAQTLRNLPQTGMVLEHIHDY